MENGPGGPYLMIESGPPPIEFGPHAIEKGAKFIKKYNAVCNLNVTTFVSVSFAI